VNRTCANVYTYVMRDPGEDDNALVQAARNGDRQALALLYHRYKLDTWNLAYLTLRSFQEAEDSVQETFVKAMVALGSVAPPGRPVYRAPRVGPGRWGGGGAPASHNGDRAPGWGRNPPEHNKARASHDTSVRGGRRPRRLVLLVVGGWARGHVPVEGRDADADRGGDRGHRHLLLAHRLRCGELL
jgi:hypothetical protein